MSEEQHNEENEVEAHHRRHGATDKYSANDEPDVEAHGVGGGRISGTNYSAHDDGDDDEVEGHLKMSRPKHS